METLDFDDNDIRNNCSPDIRILTQVRESTIEKKVTHYAKSKGWLTFKWVSPSQRGVPDRLFFRSGTMVMVEFKAPGRSPSLYQEAIHRCLKNQGFDVHIIDDVELGKALLN